MKKVLIITYYWPPSGGPGVQRWLKFVKYFHQHGIEPIVVTVDEKKASYPVLDPALENEIPKGTRIFKTNSFEPLRIFSSFFKKEKVPYAGIPDRNKMSLAGKLSLYIRANYFIPDARKGWNKYAYKQCCSIIENEKIDCIVTTSPPHSTQLIGLKLQKKYGVKWIADLRDPWTDMYYYSKLHHNKRAKEKDSKLEKLVLSMADLITVTSNETKNLFAKKISGSEKIHIVTNGYDEADIATSSTNDKNNAFTIGFSGTISKEFGIETFLTCIKKHIDSHKNIHVQFVGNVEPALKNEIETILGPHASFTGYVSHKQAIHYSAKANVLLLVVPPGQDGKNSSTVPGKTFEYLSTQNPVICLAPPHSSAVEIIEQCDAGRGFTHDDEIGIGTYLNSLYENWAAGKNIKINNTNFKQYERKTLAQQMAGIIKRLT